MKSGSTQKRSYPERRRKFPELGLFLKNARQRLRDPDTGKIPQVRDMAKLLNVKTGFVYQVEQGIRKPKESKLRDWASVYGIYPLSELWKCIGKIPMDFVATFKPETEPEPHADPYTSLTSSEKSLLLPYLDFVRWRFSEQLASTTSRNAGTVEKQS